MTRIKMAVLRWSYRFGLVDRRRVEDEVHQTVEEWLRFLASTRHWHDTDHRQRHRKAG